MIDEKLIYEIIGTDFSYATFNQLAKDQNGYKKIVMKKIEEENKSAYFQFEYQTEKQVFHKNIFLGDLFDEMVEIIKISRQMFFRNSLFEYDIKISKKGKLFVNKIENKNETKSFSHNREKKYILKNNEKIDFLIRLGIMDKEGRVKKTRYDKFKQLNRYIEFVDDAFLKLEGDNIKIIDFGCGKSYLTFALYYYFTKIKNIDVQITGLDLKEDVIQECNKISNDLGYENLCFEIGDIKDYAYTGNVDMVVSLHACDTATDFALQKALEWKAKVIFAVPCCQHEVNMQLKGDELQGILKYGLIKERVASLITDALRAEILIGAGYDVSVMEFIDMEHTPKNILIRAYREIEKEYEETKTYKKITNQLGIETTLGCNMGGRND